MYKKLSIIIAGNLWGTISAVLFEPKVFSRLFWSHKLMIQKQLVMSWKW